MTYEYAPDVLTELHVRIAGCLEQWALSPATSITLLNISENATFALSDPSGRDLILRVHRVGYSSIGEIHSELAWMDALRRDGVIRTALPITGADGEQVQVLESKASEAPRFAVAFERLAGIEPDVSGAVHWFEQLGQLTASMHLHAKSWSPPTGFKRKCWDFDAIVGPSAFWGPWRNAIGLDEAGAQILTVALEHIQLRLDRLGKSPDVFGLVHADLRLANLLINGTDMRVIDFDDCGWSWFMYDFAAAVSFIEEEPQLPDLLRAWCTGYRRIALLNAEHEADIPLLVVLRRIQLTAWLASHAEIPFARSRGSNFTAGTVVLARALMRGEFRLSNSA